MVEGSRLLPTYIELNYQMSDKINSHLFNVECLQKFTKVFIKRSNMAGKGTIYNKI